MALEAYISDLFKSLDLADDPGQIEYLARLVDGEDLEEEDKLEALKGMLEGEGLAEDKLDSTATNIINEWKKIDEAAKLAAEQEEAQPRPNLGKSSSSQKLTPEEEAEQTRLRKLALLKQYSLVEDDSPVAREGGPGPEEAAIIARGIRPEVSTAQLEEELRLLQLKNSKRKKQMKDGDLLLAPNLNAAKVQYAVQQQREAARQASSNKKDKDKADMKKQKDDAARKAEEKKKRSAKVERRA